MLGALAMAAESPQPKELLRIDAVAMAGVDSNVELTSDDVPAEAALDLSFDLGYVRRLGERHYVMLETDVEFDLFSGESRASRATVGGSVTWGRFLVGAGSVSGARAQPREFPRLRAELSVDYGLVARIDGRPLPSLPVWVRSPSLIDGSGLPVVDDERLDPDDEGAGPALAFVRPLHDVALRSRFRWEPHRTSRIDFAPAVRRVLQDSLSGSVARHYLQSELRLSVRQRLWRWMRMEAGYRFERRGHDERKDRTDGRLVLNTHRTRAAVELRWRPLRVRLEHAFRFRTASGGGTRTRRHTSTLQARWRLARGWAVVAELTGTQQARLDRQGRDWTRWTSSLGLRLRY